MASPSWSASNTRSPLKPTSSRAPRLRTALSFLLLLACLTSTVLADTETWSSSLRYRRHHTPTINRYELHRRKESSKDQDEDEVKEIVNKETPSKTEGKSKATTVTIQRAAKTAAATNTPLPEAFDGNLSAELSTTSD
ncbi:hypothetical protein IL306_013216, partial [Fusarium sp. DS 682]